MFNLLRRFILEDGGQELVEYALIAALIATLTFIAAVDSVGTTLQSSYLGWVAATESLWEMPAPGGP